MTETHELTFYGWDDGLHMWCSCGYSNGLGDQPMTLDAMRLAAETHQAEARTGVVPYGGLRRLESALIRRAAVNGREPER